MLDHYNLTSWLNDFTKVLFEKYEQYKQEKKEEYENKAELFNLYEYISIYYDLQGEKARKLNPYESNKKISADLNRFSKARIYLSDNKLQTIADLQGKITGNNNLYEKTERICIQNVSDLDTQDRLDKGSIGNFASLVWERRGRITKENKW